MVEAIIATVLFVLVLAVIAFDLVNRTVASLLGAGAMISLGIIAQERAASEFVDWNVIGLLAGMMVIVAILEKTGIFEYLAIKSAKWGRARAGRIMIILALVTAFLSAFLDNVTTVILMVPVTFVIADALGVSPIPLLITQVMASNVGGAATLIGDPPNILVGSAAELTFIDFLVNLTPVVVLTIVPMLGLLYFIFRRELQSTTEAEKAIGGMDAEGSIRDRVLLRRSLMVLGLVILAFLLHGVLGLEVATIALFGAAALLLYARPNVDEIVREVEWPTLLFFVGLFIIVGGLRATGVVEEVAQVLTKIAPGASPITAVVVIWGSGIASAIIDNIPFTATMIPVLQQLGETEGLSREQMLPLWWSLILGADFGGNITLIGASANVVAAGMVERSGRKITFLKWLAYGIPVGLLTLAIASAYVVLVYY